MRNMRIELSGGALSMQFPDTLTTDDVDDIEATFAVMMRVLRRTAKQPVDQTRDEDLQNSMSQ